MDPGTEKKGGGEKFQPVRLRQQLKEVGMSLLALPEKILSVGVHPGLSPGETRSLTFTNVMVILAAIQFAYYFTIGILVGYLLYAGVGAVSLGLAAIVMLLNHRRRYRPARILLTVTVLNNIFFACMFEPTHEFAPVFFLSCLAAVFLVYPPSEQKGLVRALILIVLYFVFTLINPYRQYFKGPDLTLLNYSDAFISLVCFFGLGWAYRYSMEIAEEQVEREQRKVASLLGNILPESFIRSLKRNPGLTSEFHPRSTVLFADISGFTRLSVGLTPEELVIMLNRVFTLFDGIAERYGVEKIKTIGDAYMAAVLDGDDPSRQARAVMDMAVEMMKSASQIATPEGGGISLHIGISSGPVTTGVVGLKRIAYSIWGETVTVAKQMESTAGSGEIKVSEEVRNALGGAYRFESARAVEVHNSMVGGWLYRSHVPLENQAAGGPAAAEDQVK
jgi:class 3 adenylate cyclase